MDKIKIIKKREYDNSLYEIRYNKTVCEFAMYKDSEMLHTSMSLNKIDIYWENYFNVYLK